MHDNLVSDDYMAEFYCDAHLNLYAMDIFEMNDIAFKKLTLQYQFQKIKAHLLVNPSLMFRIYNDLELKEKYHAFLRKELDKLLEDPYARQYCMQKFEKEIIQKQQNKIYSQPKPQLKHQPKPQLKHQIQPKLKKCW